MRIRVRYFVVSIAVVLLILLHVAGILGPVERVTVNILSPIQRVVSDWFSNTDNPNTDVSDARELEDRITQLTIENTILKETLRQSEAALQHEELLQSRNLKGILATVIGRPPEGDVQVLVLDKGAEAGILPGLPIITHDGILIGTIHEAEEGRSTVLLLTNTGSSIAAEIDNEGRTPGVVSGEHGLTMAMELIPQNEAVATGNAVVTSSVNERIPSNLIIGEVVDVQFETGDLFQRASLRPLVDYQRVRTVTILIP